MIRTSKHTLKFSNKDKQLILSKIYDDCKLQIEVYIDQIISGELELKTFISSKLLSNDIFKQSHYKQICYQYASNIIKSNTKNTKNKRYKSYKKLYTKLKKENRYNKFTSIKFSELKLKSIYHTKYFKKPKLNNITIQFDDRLINFNFNNISFDSFINITTPYTTEKFQSRYKHLNLPIKYHSHSNKFKNNNWYMKNNISIQKINNNFYINLFWNKESPKIKTKGKSIGLDCGYKKLLISSENKIFDVGLEKIYNKISNKKVDSKNFKQNLIYRDNAINESINKIDFKNIKTLVVEDLKNVKKNSKKKINKKFMNKLQRWSYAKVLNRLSMKCEEHGINFVKVNPVYTSQTCNKCGSINKKNRSKERFKCIDCGLEIDADHNAAINIIHRGLYNISTEKR